MSGEIKQHRYFAAQVAPTRYRLIGLAKDSDSTDKAIPPKYVIVTTDKETNWRPVVTLSIGLMGRLSTDVQGLNVEYP